MWRTKKVARGHYSVGGVCLGLEVPHRTTWLGCRDTPDMSYVHSIYSLRCPRLLRHYEPSHLGASQIYSHARADLSNPMQRIRYGAGGNPFDTCIAAIRYTEPPLWPGCQDPGNPRQTARVLTFWQHKEDIWGNTSDVTLDTNCGVLCSGYVMLCFSAMIWLLVLVWKNFIYVNIQEKNSPVVWIMRFVQCSASGGNSTSW